MCGIAGHLDYGTHHPPGTPLRSMLGMIRHRGPDQFGIYLDDYAGLGSARLSIVDLSAGQQPITTEDGRFWIVYNGEIFNHVELRRELEAGGHTFATRTDTEVLLHLYEQDGPACLDRLNGQFAVAIWDKQRRELFLARDRLGVRPLHYHCRDGTLVFASEIKALAAYPGVSLEIDPLGLDQIFTGWSCLPPRTPFKGIHQLAPGHYALINANGLKSYRYWQPFSSEASEVNTSTGQQSPEALVEMLSGLLSDATRLRLLADVPVGAYLSGGLDSSIIAALIRTHATGRIDTFSIAFNDQAFDENTFQRYMARHLGTDHQVVEARHEDIGRIFPEVVWHMESPVLRTAPAAMLMLSRLVHRSGYKVVLTGEGADEFLGGYHIFKEAKIRAFCVRQPGSKMRPRLFAALYPDLARLSELGDQFRSSFFVSEADNCDSPDFSHAVRWRNTRRTARFFSPDLASEIAVSSAPLLDSVALPPHWKKLGLLERAQYLEIATFLSPYLLSSQGDRVAMANSVEGRYPFLDPRVVSFCERLPSRHKLRALHDKVLLRKLGRQILPDEVWRRPKKPFRAPIHRCFLSSDSPDYVRDLLSDSSIKAAGFFHPVAVSKLIGKTARGLPLGETDDMAVAGIISTQLLHHQFVRHFTPRKPIDEEDDIKMCDHRTGSRHASR